MADERPDPLTDPQFEAFFVEGQAGPDPDPEARSREMQLAIGSALQTALAEVGGGPIDGWRIEPLHASRPTLFLVHPPRPVEEGPALAPGQAWEAAYRLAAQPGVVDAEPSFALHLDTGDLPPVAGEEDEEAAPEGEPADDGATAPPPVFSKHDKDWSWRLIRTPEAWTLEPHLGGDGLPPGKRFGEGIVVGHPDSGYRIHPELFNEPGGGNARVLVHLGHDFVDDDPSALDPASGHGLGTASVVMSAFEDPPLPMGFVNGVAPKAQIIPYRVAKPHLFIPAPVLFPSGMARLAKAIFRAVDAGCHVISISIGWLKNGAVEAAVQHAFEQDVILAAAAGNDVRFFVVWPAAYPGTICCAGCTSHRRIWVPSSRGKRVDVTGPAEEVWKAAVEEGQPVVVQASGTSFASASVAGMAALWLAFWGRERLLALYQGQVRLTTVFRKLLTESCDPPPENAPAGEFGRGIVNAERLLLAPLPTLAEMLASSAPLHDLAALAPAEPTVAAGERSVLKDLGDVPEAVQAAILRGLFPQDGGAPDTGDPMAGVGRELAFQILSNRPLRETLLAGPPEAAAPATADDLFDQRDRARELLRQAPLSSRLRQRAGL